MEQGLYSVFLEMENEHWWFRGRRKVYLGFVESVVGKKAGARLLDLGCGFGSFLAGLKEMGFEVYGADSHIDGLAQCRTRGFNRCAAVDAHRLPYPNHSFDVVTMFDVLEHMENDRLCLAEVVRVLRPGGIVIISVPAYQYLYANGDKVAQHYRRYNRNMIKKLFESVELDVLRNGHSNVMLFPLILIAVLLSKLVEAVIAPKMKLSNNNLYWPMPKFLHELFYRIFSAELVVTRHHDWPLGHSMIVAGQVPLISGKQRSQFQH